LIFKFLKGFGQIDLVISLLYIFVLGFIGFSMAYESFKAVFKIKSQSMKLNRKDKLYNKLPFKIYFPRSDLTISLLIPVFVSIFSGILVSIMGIGGGFIMIPAMIYILGMPTSVVVGTSLFQVIFVTSNVTILHILTTQSVDILLAGILLVSSVVGAQFGTRVALFCPAEKLRAILAVIILTLVFKLALGFFIAPINPFEVMLIDEN